MTKIGEKESKQERNRKKKKKKKTSASDIILMLIFIIALAVAIFAGYKLYSIFAEYKAGVDEYSQIADTVVKERDADTEKVKQLKDAKGKIVKHIKKRKSLLGQFLLTVKIQKISPTRTPSCMGTT